MSIADGKPPVRHVGRGSLLLMTQRPPVESIEIYLDEHSERLIRSVWQQLDDAGMSSMARGQHTPHLTLAVAEAGGERLMHAADAARGELAGLVGAPMQLAGPGLFMHQRSVLYASVVPTRALLATQERVARSAEARGIALLPTALPRQWTPHVTLAKRLRSEHFGEALQLMQEVPWPIHATVRSIIHWDGTRREVSTIVR
jgi:2'-5' RNA ligase